MSKGAGTIAVWLLIALAAAMPTGCGGNGGTTTSGQPGERKNYPECTLVDEASPNVAGLKGIALDSDGQIYLAGSAGVAVLDRNWAKVHELPTATAAVAVAVGADGKVYVAERQTVRVFDPAGTEVASWGEVGEGPGQLSYVTAIAVAGPNVWVADAGKRVIHRFATTGDFIDEVGERDPQSGGPGIICPSPYLDCVTDTDGTMWVGNPGRWRVEHYDLNNQLTGFWGRQGMTEDRFQGCCNPTNVAVGPNGLFATSEKSGARVKISDSRGEVVAMVPRRYFAGDATGIDLAMDGAGRLYAADPASGKVFVFAMPAKAAAGSDAKP